MSRDVRDVKRCQEMSRDVKRCQEMSRDVKRCQEMSRDVKRCQEMSRDVKRCQESRVIIGNHQNPRTNEAARNRSHHDHHVR